jgi:hypothetical protein
MSPTASPSPTELSPEDEAIEQAEPLVSTYFQTKDEALQDPAAFKHQWFGRVAIGTAENDLKRLHGAAGEIADAHLATQVEEVQQVERARLASMADDLSGKSSVAYDAYIGAHGRQSLSATEFADRKNTAFSNAYRAWINLAEQEGESGT